ncbi:MAG: hypothetical protein ABIJ61_06300 [bacterium]
MQKSRINPQRLIGVILIVAAVALWGCSDNLIEPVPGSTPSLDDHPPGDGPAGPPVVDNGTRIDAGTGGIVEIGNSLDDVTCRLVVTAQSLTEDTIITIELAEIHDADSNYLDFVFEPAGLSFNAPAWLEVDVALFNDPELTHVDWFYFQPSAQRWVLQGKYPPKNGIVKIPLRHFSTYRGLSQGGQIGDPQAK